MSDSGAGRSITRATVAVSVRGRIPLFKSVSFMPKDENEKVRARFNVWKTVRVGDYKGADAHRKALSKKGMNISRWADHILGNIDVAGAAVEVDLVKVLSAQLGFTGAARREEVHRRAFSMGLELCVPDVGPRLREEYTDQPFGEWVIIGMDAVRGSAGYPEVFVVERDDYGASWLNSFWVISGHLWSPESRWIFTLPQR